MSWKFVPFFCHFWSRSRFVTTFGRLKATSVWCTLVVARGSCVSHLCHDLRFMRRMAPCSPCVQQCRSASHPTCSTWCRLPPRSCEAWPQRSLSGPPAKRCSPKHRGRTSHCKGLVQVQTPSCFLDGLRRLWPGLQWRCHGLGAQVLLPSPQSNGRAQEHGLAGAFNRPGRVQKRRRRSGAGAKISVKFWGPRGLRQFSGARR